MQITKNIYSVGVLNPSLRVFDIVMETDYGTSYNSFLIKGTEKTALIETSHTDYSDEYIENIRQFTKIEDIDYVIMQHNEPDHSGSLERILKINPNIEIITSNAGAMYLKSITNNENLKFKKIKDNDVIDLGEQTLKFIVAPFLHWPDSFFTWVENEKTLFSCDFLGAHYCEPRMIDTDIKEINGYKEALEYYYNCIFLPFSKFVEKGLEKISDLDIDYICTSHGPVLSKGGMLEYAVGKYSKWSAKKEDDTINIPIFYCSAYGYTGIIAENIKQGIDLELKDANVNLYDLNNFELSELLCIMNTSTGFLIGSPTLNRNAVEPIWSLLAHIDAINCQNKPVATFGSFGWSGEAVPLLNGYLSALKCKLVLDGLKIGFKPSGADIELAKEYGKNFALSLKN